MNTNTQNFIQEVANIKECVSFLEQMSIETVVKLLNKEETSFKFAFECVVGFDKNIVYHPTANAIAAYCADFIIKFKYDYGKKLAIFYYSSYKNLGLYDAEIIDMLEFFQNKNSKALLNFL